MKSGSSYSYCSDYSNLSSGEIDWELEIIKNQYIVLKKLGSGAYATVWLVYNINDLKYYAMKISNCDDYKVCSKETNIYNMIKGFKCDYLMTTINTFDFDFDDNLYHCQVMELMGNCLYDYIKLYEFDLENVISMTKQILLG